MAQLSILIPAAGLSLRMQGQDKLLMQIDGIACLARTAMAAVSVCAQVVVVLRPDFPDRLRALAGVSVDTVLLEPLQDTMSASLRAGLGKIAQQASGVMIIPADMPEIDAADMCALRDAFLDDPQQLYRGATAMGKPGHPVIFPRRLFYELAQLAGDKGAQSVLHNHAQDIRLVGLPAEHALMDLDTRAEWADWTAARQALRQE